MGRNGKNVPLYFASYEKMIRITRKREQKFYYSPLRYPGGKTFLFSFFDKIIKQLSLQNVTFVEPFAGGAGASLALLFLEKVEAIVINDLDKAIYSFWKSAIFDAEKFIEKIFSIPISVKEWKRQKQIYSDSSSNSFDLGFATFYLNRTNVSGILDGGPIGGLDQRGKWKIDARFNKLNLIQKIKQLSLYKNRISVFNEDGVHLIPNYLKKNNTFIYLDPPYYDKGASLYLNHYKKQEHEFLALRLNQHAESFWLLTYDNKKEIRRLYPNRKIRSFSLNYNAHTSRKGKEIVIYSDAIVA